MNTHTVSSVSTITSIKAPGSSGDQNGANSGNNAPPPKRIMPSTTRTKATFPRVKVSIEERGAATNNNIRWCVVAIKSKLSALMRLQPPRLTPIEINSLREDIECTMRLDNWSHHVVTLEITDEGNTGARANQVGPAFRATVSFSGLRARDPLTEFRAAVWLEEVEATPINMFLATLADGLDHNLQPSSSLNWDQYMDSQQVPAQQRSRLWFLMVHFRVCGADESWM